MAANASLVRADSALEFRKLSPDMEGCLADFFHVLSTAGDTSHFHPHPFTAEAAKERCHYTGRDLYYVAISNGNVQAYGMLRGWDEGYEVPSLGIAVHPRARGIKLGSAMMHFLHSAARQRGASRIRLRVYKDNITARSMYEKLGYHFEGEQEGQLVGFCELT
jgi:ribosomal-protein-alanine N-acetyltransferase